MVGNVVFDNVDFSYDGKKQILHGINLYADKGQKVAFVGATGAGKTTITNLINRFYDIQSGMITYDGIDIKLIEKDSLRRSLGIVLQDTHLFTGTIAENIAYGRADATREEILEAARIANVDSFVKHLDQGYETVLRDGPLDGRSDSLCYRPPSIDDCQFRCHHGDGPRTYHRTRQPCFLDGRTWHLLPPLHRWT